MHPSPLTAGTAEPYVRPCRGIGNSILLAAIIDVTGRRPNSSEDVCATPDSAVYEL